jgi:hypothetical protein
MLRGSQLARRMLYGHPSLQSRDPGRRVMKDLLLIVVSVAFFAVAWVYARSFDRL